MTMKRRGSIAALLAGLALMAQPAAAFKKHEHEALSNLALAVALESLQGEVPADVKTRISAWFLNCSPDPETRLKACKKDQGQCVPFGLLTRAVDRVIRPEGLIPSRRLHLEPLNAELEEELRRTPDRCVEAQSVTTKTMKEKLGGSLSESAVIQFASCRAEKKVKHFWTWFLAAHQNTSHFEACAAAKYNALHHLAIELATESGQARPRAESLFVAFAAEAVALHFLQDSFAPGHLLTPRGGSTDIIGRGIHNTHNRNGAPAFVTDAAPLPEIRDALQRVLRGSPNSDAVKKAIETLLNRTSPSDSHPSCTEETLVKSALYFGDRKLPCRQQAIEMVLVSAASIREVLLAQTADPLRIVFQDWSAQPQTTDNERLPEEERPAENTLWRPWLLVTNSASAELPAEQRAAMTLAGFESKQLATRLDRFHASLRNPELSVARVFGDSGQEPGWRAEAALPFGSANDIDIQRRDRTSDALVPCTEKDQDPCYFQEQSGLRQFGLPLTWNLQGETWPGYDSLGLTLRGWPLTRRKGKLGWDLMAGVEAGWKWYFSEARNTSRGVWGGHVAAGLGILFLDLGFERGSMLVGKDHKRNSNYSIGLRFQVP